MSWTTEHLSRGLEAIDAFLSAIGLSESQNRSVRDLIATLAWESPRAPADSGGPAAEPEDDEDEDGACFAMDDERFFGHAGYYELLIECMRLHSAKNRDYADPDDPLRNLRASERFGVLAEDGVFRVRLQDKIARFQNLLEREATDGLGPAVADESFEDTIKDLINYCALGLVLRRERQRQDEEERAAEDVWKHAHCSCDSVSAVDPYADIDEEEEVTAPSDGPYTHTFSTGDYPAYTDEGATLIKNVLRAAFASGATTVTVRP